MHSSCAESCEDDQSLRSTTLESGSRVSWLSRRPFGQFVARFPLRFNLKLFWFVPDGLASSLAVLWAQSWRNFSQGVPNSQEASSESVWPVRAPASCSRSFRLSWLKRILRSAVREKRVGCRRQSTRRRLGRLFPLPLSRVPPPPPWYVPGASAAPAPAPPNTRAQSISPAAQRRLLREFSSLSSSPPEGVRLAKETFGDGEGEGDMRDVKAWVQGPLGTPFAGECVALVWYDR